MGNMKTPGVYIVEKNAFPNSVVEVATAVPAFIGYTETAVYKGNSLHMRPWRISSMAEFIDCFGGPPAPGAHLRFELGDTAPDAEDADPKKAGVLGLRDAEPLLLGTKKYYLKQTHGLYLLHQAMKLFFQNNGGPCYVVSVGSYATTESNGKEEPTEGVTIAKEALKKGVDALENELEPTMVVIPEAVLLSRAECYALGAEVLSHCGMTMKNRVAILDVWEGYRGLKDSPMPVKAFRDDIGTNFLAYGSAYYPWLDTTVTAERDMSYQLLPASAATLVTAIKADIDLNSPEAKRQAQKDEVDRITTATTEEDIDSLKKSLPVMSGFYKRLQTEMARRLNLLPPSAAMAGVYTMVDNTRGVWKAPANVSLNVVGPRVSISHADQEDLNVTPQGKSINAIRTFIGEGTLVWGARTLDGNSLDWRYINVRRTMIMLEESIRLAAKAMVFEPNVGSTWVTMKSMISNFLTGIWKRGGLAGATPEDAFSVHVGLGETMTPEDILEGILRVTVLVAISRPAEFIEITFQQQMQKS
jgi:phage tail sheath protein FI